MIQIYANTGELLIETEVFDSSSSYRSIDGRHELTLKFSLESHKDIPIGSWCMFEDARFEVMSHADVTMRNTKHYEYSVLFKSDFGLLSRFKIANPVDGRLSFDMVAKPHEFVELIVSNLNGRDEGWSVGECIDSAEKLVSFSHTSCEDALISVAETFETEYEVVGKTISLKKVEYNKETPLALEYGKGKGFRPGIGRGNFEDGLPTHRMFIEGGDRNISYKDYGSETLHLPKSYHFLFDGEKFDGEEGFDDAKAKSFATDENGYSVFLTEGNGGKEDSIDVTEIYPSRVGTVSAVVFNLRTDKFDEPQEEWTEEDWNNVQVDIVDDTIPEELDFKQCLIGNDPLTVIFQSGELSGREFDASFIKSGNVFELEKQEYSGLPMPQGLFIPKKGDTYAVFNVFLPESYISNPSTHSGAEFDALRAATRSLYDKSEQKFTFRGELDPIFTKKDWVNIGGKIKIGGYVSFTHEGLLPDGPALVRIVGITQSVNNPYTPKIELSNMTHRGSVSSRINQIENSEAHVDELHKTAKRYTKVRFADALRSISILEEAFGKGFTESVRPATVQTMMMLVGDESLQFMFVESMDSMTQVAHSEYFDTEARSFKCDEGFLKHMTLGIKELHSGYDQNYRCWSIPAYESAVLTDEAAEYYVYASVERDGSNGEFRLESSPIDMYEVDDRYYLLLGLLLAESDGSRSYMPLYGFTQILPGQITADVIRSADGECYFDLKNNEIGGVINFKAGSKGVENLNLHIGNQNMLRNSGFTGDYLSEPLTDSTVMDAAKKLYSSPLDHWEATEGVRVVDLADVSASGYGIHIEASYDSISQTLYHKTIAGESYVFSFKAKADFVESAVEVTCGGLYEHVTVTSEWKRYSVKITATETTDVFTLEGTGITICELQLERGTMSTAWDNSWLDNSSDRTYWQSMKYLQQALAGSTTTAGGLVLTNAILLGDHSNDSEFVERAGANGLYENDDTPAFWAGGNIDKAVATVGKYKDNPAYQPTEEELAGMAQFVVTHGGRAILNDGIFRGTIYARNGVFGGRLQLGFQMIENEHTLSLSDSSSLWLYGSMEDAVLVLPEDDRFDGWQLNVFAYPVISKMDGQPYIRGRILCPHKTTNRLYYASEIYLTKGGYMQFAYSTIKSEWILVNDQSADASYTEYTE